MSDNNEHLVEYSDAKLFRAKYLPIEYIHTELSASSPALLAAKQTSFLIVHPAIHAVGRTRVVDDGTLLATFVTCNFVDIKGSINLHVDDVAPLLLYEYAVVLIECWLTGCSLMNSNALNESTKSLPLFEYHFTASSIITALPTNHRSLSTHTMEEHSYRTKMAVKAYIEQFLNAQHRSMSLLQRSLVVVLRQNLFTTVFTENNQALPASVYRAIQTWKSILYRLYHQTTSTASTLASILEINK